MIGTTAGKYRIQDRIGRGGMGTVYLAVDPTLQREVAIKVLNPELNVPDVARRFQAEAVTVAKLSHPGIATVHELFEHGGQWLMVMEFVRGETLEHLIDRTGFLPIERVVDLCAQALTALAHAHSMGVVHRDLKPANLMITESGHVKIMDFGIARVTGSEHLTTAGLTMGTPSYMSPEQFLGGEIDTRADLYAMGVVLYRLATSKLPFTGDTPFAIAQSQVRDPPTPIRVARAGLPEWIEPVIGRALSKDPADRFQTADEFRDALARGLAGLTIASGPNAFTPGGGVPVPVAVTPPAGNTSNRTTMAAAIAAALIVLIGSGVWWSRSRSAPPISAPAAAPVTAATQAPAPVAPPVVETPPAKTPKATPAPVAAPRAAPAAPAAPETPAVFSDAKMIEVAGKKSTERDVVLTFAGGQISLVPKKGGEAILTRPYGQVTRATYVRAKNPAWDLTLPHPTDELNLPGILRGAREWLVLQWPSGYLILELHGSNFRAVLDATTARTGVKVDIRR